MKFSLPNAPLHDSLGAQTVFSALVQARANPVLTKGEHRHPHGELFLLQSGYVRSVAAAGRWLIPAGHLCWVPPLEVHGGQTDNTTGIRIHLAKELCATFPATSCVLPATPLIVAIIDQLTADGMLRIALSKQERRLLHVINDEMHRTRKLPTLLPMPKDPKLRQVAERWLERPDDPAGLSELAEGVEMSSRSLTRNFKLETGLAIGDWRQIARLMRAVDMLSAGSSVTETALAVGYDSMSSFSDLCQRHLGMSPKVLARTLAAGAGPPPCKKNSVAPIESSGKP